VHVLDNPVWHALTGPQQTVAEGSASAFRYEPDVAVFAAVPDEPPPTTWDELRTLVGPGGVAVLFAEPATMPASWERRFRIPCLQMVGAEVERGECRDAVPLGTADVDDMLALVERTRPGPFARRTIELGDYLGVRDDEGALIAMTGMRMHAPGYVEISAVCTDVKARGRGLASALVRDMVGRIRDRGECPLLHVAEDNVGAIPIYEMLGFETRLRTEIIGARAPK
jgi:ribosomal protein S18 acetylase RimI-like enzyme